MNKTFKGAGAAVAAGVLLMGGAGSLAFWTDSDTVTGEDVSSGTLALGPVTGDWTLNGDVVDDISAVAIVPGDNLDYVGEIPVTATGDNLEGNLVVDWATPTGTLATEVVTTTTASYNGAPVVDGANTTFDADDLDKNIGLAIDVDYAWGTSAAGPETAMVLNLEDLSVTLTQTDATPVVP